MHHVAVEHQVGVPHGDRAVLVQHAATEPHGGDVVKVDVVDNASVQRQVYGCVALCGVVVVEHGALRCGSDDVFLSTGVGEAVEEIGSPNVRYHRLQHLAVAGACGYDADAGAYRAVFVVYASTHSAPRRA